MEKKINIGVEKKSISSPVWGSMEYYRIYRLYAIRKTLLEKIEPSAFHFRD